MKKYLLLALVLGASFPVAYADSDIELRGGIASIDANSHTLNITTERGDVSVFVAPYTKIKGDNCGTFGQDVSMDFASLKEGMFVDVDAIPNNNNLVAKEIEIDCQRKMAY